MANDKTWRSYDLPKPAEEVKWHIFEIWDGRATDELYTDTWSEVERIVPAMLEQAYDVVVYENNRPLLYVKEENHIPELVARVLTELGVTRND